MVCLPFRRLFLFAGLLLFASGSRAAAEEELPDSLLTEDYLYEYTFTDFGKARRIIERMRERKILEPYRLDIAEGDLYFNTGEIETEALESSAAPSAVTMTEIALFSADFFFFAFSVEVSFF